MSLNTTPNASRLHIGIFGRRNAGKSSLINALTDQETALVSPVAGTTTDPVYKAMELKGFGPSVFIDTAGLDDTGELGALRVQRTQEAAKMTDVAIFVFTDLPAEEDTWIREFQSRKVPVAAVVNRCDCLDPAPIIEAIRERYGLEAIPVSAKTGENMESLRKKLLALAPENFWELTITGDLVQAGDSVLLVMPQDIQAPRGRLILPQQQTLRELLDKGALIMSTTVDRLPEALEALSRPPKLIITDSQVFPQVYGQKPQESLLTSFSILFAGYKGDIHAFIQGAAAIENLTENSRVLIAEACAHSPTEEDIGREKIPKLLRKKAGQGLTVEFVRGNDFPETLAGYDLVIHCGACMFGRRHVLSRIHQAQQQQVPICNYGIAIAALTGILDKVCYAQPSGGADQTEG